MTFQAIAPTSAANTTCGVDDVGADDARADRLGDMQAEEQEGDEVEERGPEHGILRPQHARRDDGGDGIRCVVQAVQEVEEQRDADQADEKRKGEGRRPSAQTFSITMPLISLATSSKRSTTFSSWP